MDVSGVLVLLQTTYNITTSSPGLVEKLHCTDLPTISLFLNNINKESLVVKYIDEEELISTVLSFP